MNNTTKPAARVVAALAVIKWVLVALWIGGGIAGVLMIAAASSWPKWTVWLEVPVIATAVVGAALSWVSIGWRQQVLAMLVMRNRSSLVGIAKDSARAGEPVEVRL